MGAYGKFMLPYAPMLNIFLQNSKKIHKISGKNIIKTLKNYKNFEKKFNMGAYGEMILTWVHMGSLYSHMHPCYIFFLPNSKKLQKFEKKFNMGAYGEMILTWVHMGSLYSHMHPC